MPKKKAADDDRCTDSARSAGDQRNLAVQTVMLGFAS
jgi:hypothetical protein